MDESQAVRPIFNFRMCGAGWAWLELGHAGRMIRLLASWLSNPITDIVIALISLCNEPDSVLVEVFDEPGIHEIRLTRTQQTVFMEISSRPEGEDGALVLRGAYNVLLLDLIDAVLLECDRLAVNPGLERFEELWDDDFPIRELKKLKSTRRNCGLASGGVEP